MTAIKPGPSHAVAHSALSADPCLIDLAHSSIALLATGMGASMNVMTKLDACSTTPMERGLTAIACALGRVIPKQNTMFLASSIPSPHDYTQTGSPNRHRRPR